MFRTAELQRKLPKEDYHQQVPQLREELLMMQMELRKADFPSSWYSPEWTAPARAKPSTSCTSGWIRAGWLPAPSASRPTRSAIARNTGGSGGSCRPRGGWVVSQFLVFGADSRPCLWPRRPGRIRRAAGADQILRENPGRRWRADPEILDAFVQGRAEGAACASWKRIHCCTGEFPSATGNTGNCTISSSPPPSARS
jgi:hypothetical protein